MISVFVGFALATSERAAKRAVRNPQYFEDRVTSCGWSVPHHVTSTLSREPTMNRPAQRRGAYERRPAHTPQSYLLAFALSAIGALPAVGMAKSNTILVLSKEYTADLSMAYTSAGTPVTQKRSQDSSKPLDVVLAGPGDIRAEGSAGAFYVSASTSAHNNPPLRLSATTAQASATASVTFAALPGQHSPLSLDYLDAGLPFYSFSADIFDATTHTDVYSLDWSYGEGPLPLTGASGSLPIDSSLVPFHIYDLTLEISTSAANDSESLTLSISGLNPITLGRVGPLAETLPASDTVALAVPEPASLSLILAAVGWFLLRRSTRPR
jgi:hypothetical protein